MVMAELYELDYNILSRMRLETEPFSGVLFNPAENIYENSLYESLCRAYLERNVKEHTGLNIDEFLSRTIEDIQLLIKLCNEKEEEKKKDRDDLSKALKNIE